MIAKLFKAALWTIATFAFLIVALYVSAGLGIGSYGVMVLMLCLAVVIQWWRKNKRQEWLIRTPTTRIAQAKTGRIELYGQAQEHDGQLLRDPVQDLPCVWFAVKTFPGQWTHLMRAKPSIAVVGFGKRGAALLKEAMSSRPFVLRDASGACLIDPAEAELDIHPAGMVYDKALDVTHMVWRVVVGKSLTVFGHFQKTNADELCGHVTKPPDSQPYIISFRTPRQYENE